LGAEFVVEEIVFFEGEGEAFWSPAEELGELGGGEEVPVLADDGDVDAAELIVGEGEFGREAEGAGEGEEVGGGGFEDGGEAGEIGEFPVAPEELAGAVGEVGFEEGGEGGLGEEGGGGGEGEEVAAGEHGDMVTEPGGGPIAMLGHV
jgi:hypothetical protein